MEFIYEKKDHIAVMTFNRPQAMNSLGGELTQGLYDSLVDFGNDANLWVGILTGAGEKAFCAGADLKRTKFSQEEGSASRSLWHTIVRELKIYKPLIAAINGYCLGGGLELALLCDLRIAAEHARFGMPEVTRGISPGGGGTQRLPRLLTWCHAAQLLFIGKHIDAQTACRMGLVNEVVSKEQLMPRAMEWAGIICDNAPLAVRTIKEAMLNGAEMTLNESLSWEMPLINRVFSTEDFAEGRKAFAERRKPIWRGK